MENNIHTIAVGETKAIRIKAKDEFSSEKINIAAGEVYSFSWDPDERWIDSVLIFPLSGGFNLAASLAGKRVKGVKCFCICGAYNDDDDQAFAIGAEMNVPHTMAKTGTLSFFANDTKGFYNNNKGVVTINATRLS